MEVGVKTVHYTTMSFTYDRLCVPIPPHGPGSEVAVAVEAIDYPGQVRLDDIGISDEECTRKYATIKKIDPIERVVYTTRIRTCTKQQN